jgi:hypothetical protein
MKTMKVMRFNDSADAPALIAATTSVPPPRPGEMLIHIQAAGVTPTELRWHPTTHELKICVGGVVPLAQASAAYFGAAGRQLGRGKVVITLIEEPRG